MKSAGEALDLSPDSVPELEAPEAQGAATASIVDRLFREHTRRVQRFMSFRLRDREDGQEASQEVFLKLWRQETEGHLRQDARSYMYSATRSTVIDLERNRASRGADRQDEADCDALPAAVPGEEDVLHWRRAMRHFVTILKAVPEPTRQAFLLHYFSDMNYDQIAAKLGTSRRSVERHVARALSHCRRHMREYL